MSNKTLLIDFDGVLHRARYGNQKREIYDEPMDGAVFTTNNLAKAGYNLIVFTSRPDEDFVKIKTWLDKHEFPQMSITNKKLTALAYIDDRGIRFTSWADICHYFI